MERTQYMTRTSIEWVRNPGEGSQGFTVNPIRFRNKQTGKVGHYCEKLSPGCKNCYASRMQKGPYLSGLEFTAENKSRGELFFDENVLQQVLRRRKPSTFFWADCTDLFGDWVPDEWIDRCAATCALTPHHRHLWLTKRAKRMREYFGHSDYRPVMVGAASKSLSALTFTLPSEDVFDARRIAWGQSWKINAWPLPNLGLGVSAEDQERADERIPDLLQTPAAMRFVSEEPLLGPISHRWAKWEPLKIGFNGQFDGLRGIHWVICGGESGPGARPMHPDWPRGLRDQCQAAGVPFFFKQWGEWLPTGQKQHYSLATLIDPPDDRTPGQPMGDAYIYRVGKKSAGRLLDGRVWDEMPEMLR
jgi:protein gp37